MYWEQGGPSLEQIYGIWEKYNIYRVSLNLFSSSGNFGPLKIFYGQKVAHMYIGKKEAILENVYAKNEKNISIFRYWYNLIIFLLD